jgi:hypothetical protein
MPLPPSAPAAVASDVFPSAQELLPEEQGIVMPYIHCEVTRGSYAEPLDTLGEYGLPAFRGS